MKIVQQLGPDLQPKSFFQRLQHVLANIYSKLTNIHRGNNVLNGVHK